MNVVLDTCAVLALARGDLPRGAAAALRRSAEAWVSVVSAWEVAIKADAGKLRLKGPVEEWFQGLVDRYELRDVPLDVRTACAAAALPPVHRDPIDRVIVAVALAHGLAVLTSDENIAGYPGVKTIW
ncbi:MAG: type II toxin-antitoxin system VapC family toxin [Vicinamibacterales bacterium]|nr:type II toxin-antitoxin system VapC family toxin [Vicinamibacterales bacterium]